MEATRQFHNTISREVSIVKCLKDSPLWLLLEKLQWVESRWLNSVYIRKSHQEARRFWLANYRQ